MRIEVDRERCVGSGLCALSVPEVFDQDQEDGLVVLRQARAGADPGRLREAVRLCPSGALALAEDPPPAPAASK